MKEIKRICLVDPLSPYGHKDVNNVLIKQLSDLGELTVMASNGLISNREPGVEYMLFDDVYFKIGKNSFDNRKRLFSVFREMCHKINSGGFDLVIFSSYEVIITFLGLNLCRMLDKRIYSKLYILNHSNIDDIRKSRIKEFAYRMLDKKITNLCYEDFIGRYIEAEYGKKWARLRHNISDYKKDFSLQDISQDITQFFGTDGYTYIIFVGEVAFKNEIVKRLIELDRCAYLEEKKIKVFIKDKEVKYKSKCICSYNSYLSEDEYSYIFDKCHYVGIIYNPDEYIYRVSGIFYDAVTFGKPVLYCNSMFFENIASRYGDIGVCFLGDIKDTLDELQMKQYTNMCQNIATLQKEYSDKNLANDLLTILK